MESVDEWTGFSIAAALGAVLTIMIGFGLGGWMTSGGANDRGLELAQLEVTAALVPYCIDRARQDPNFAPILNQMKTESPMRGARAIMKAGWVFSLTTGKPDFRLAYGCRESLVAEP